MLSPSFLDERNFSVQNNEKKDLALSVVNKGLNP